MDTKIVVILAVSMASEPMRHAGDAYECDEAEAARLVRAGYAQGPEGWEVPPEPDTEDAEPASLVRLTKPQLLELAAAEEIAVKDNATKAEIIAAIEAARGEREA